jgi:hypothetical protein
VIARRVRERAVTRAASGLDVRERFRLWLYTSPGAQAAASAPSPWDWLHRVDTTLPD